MVDEFAVLMRNKTWILVLAHPGCNVINYKWVHKIMELMVKWNDIKLS
jgi:hypothetical protein